MNKKQRYKTSRSFSRFFILPFLSLALLISSASSVIQTQSASAAYLSQDQIDKQIQSLIIYRALGACLRHETLPDSEHIVSNFNRISDANAKDGVWFGDAPVETFGLPLGAYMRQDSMGFPDVGDDYKTDCNAGGVTPAKKAIGLWGITGPELLCNIGFVRASDPKQAVTVDLSTHTVKRDTNNLNLCIGGSGDFKYGDGLERNTEASMAYESYILKKVYGKTVSFDSNNNVSYNPIDDWSNATWYWYYSKSFNWSCGYGQMGTSYDSKAKAGNDNKSYNIYSPNKDGSVNTDKWYRGVLTDSDEIIIRPSTARDNAEWKKSCSFMAGEINRFATDYAKNSLEETLTTSCKAAYPTTGVGVDVRANQLKAAACIAGGVNKENATYCADTYPDESLLAACKAGAGIARGIPAESATPDRELDTPGGEGSSPTCGIEGIGWIVCPLMGFLGSISDTAFGFLSTSFLETSADYVQVGGPAYNAWVVMRNFANVAFVIVFLLIIFSQLTGYGVSNYGVKKMLPRLVIAAILVNISFFVCQVAVDLSNILGYSLKSLFDSIGTLIQPAGTVSGDATGNGIGIAAIVAAVLVGGVTLLFSITVPIVLAVVLALLMIVLILLGRTALIILLLIISPLAFVAYLLPNTEDWFKKWYKLFFSLLLLFPIIAVVFGASGLAGKIIYDSASGDMIRQLMGVGVAAIPLFVVPSLLKGALNATGQLGAKLSGLANKAGGNVGSKYKSTSRLAAFNEARRRNAQIRRAQITGGVYNGKNPFSKASSAVSGAFNASRISGAAGTKLAQQSAALANKLDVEDIEAANAQIKQANISDADLKRVANGEAVKGINGRDGAARAAAMMEQTRRGNFGDLQSSWNGMLGESPAVKRRVSQAFSSFADKPGFIGQGVLGQLSRGEGAPAEQTLEYLAANGGDRYSAQKIASTSKEELGYLLSQQTTATATNPTGGIQGELIDAANEAFSNPDISGLIGNNRNAIMDIATNPAPRR